MAEALCHLTVTGERTCSPRNRLLQERGTAGIGASAGNRAAAWDRLETPPPRLSLRCTGPWRFWPRGISQNLARVVFRPLLGRLLAPFVARENRRETTKESASPTANRSLVDKITPLQSWTRPGKK